MKKKNIFIHPTHIENRDETNKKLEKKKIEPRKTGFTDKCKVTQRPSRLNPLLKLLHLQPVFHRYIHLTDDFVQKRCRSHCAIIFKQVNKDEIYFQPVPAKYMKRTNILHVKKKWMGNFRRWAYKAYLDVPEPSTIFYTLGMHPLTKSATFTLQEWRIMDDAEGELNAFKFII